MRNLVTVICLACLLAVVSINAEAIEYRFFQGLTDGSDRSDGAEYIVLVEEKKEDPNPTEVYRLQWDQQEWTEEQVVDLSPWGRKNIWLKTLGSPGLARNIGWDWLAIGEPRIMVNDKIHLDLLKLHQEGKTTVTTILDQDKKDKNDVVGKETDGVQFGGTADAGDRSCGGENKPSIFQHPAWNGQVGDTVVRWEIDLTDFSPFAVEAKDKLAVTWGSLKQR